MRARLLHAAPLAAGLALLLPAAAEAHGLHTDTADRSILGYVWLGIRHMVGGWDHLLFIAGVVVLAGAVRGAAKLISLFVAGHSMTLIVATVAGWTVSPEVVDALIALSVAFIGWRILKGRPEVWWPTATAIFAFGLVHGLGLSSRLQELDLPSGGALLARVIAFNVGVEIGQLAALVVLVGVGLLVVRHLPDRDGARRTIAGTLVAVGLLAALVLSFVAMNPDTSTAEQETEAVGACVEQAYEPPPVQLGGAHPDRRFYPLPGAPSDDDLAHVLIDGYVIVRYRPDLPSAQRAQLRRWVHAGPRGVIVAPGRPTIGQSVAAQTRERELGCAEVDETALAQFRDDWFAGLNG